MYNYYNCNIDCIGIINSKTCFLKKIWGFLTSCKLYIRGCDKIQIGFVMYFTCFDEVSSYKMFVELV